MTAKEKKRKSSKALYQKNRKRILKRMAKIRAGNRTGEEKLSKEDKKAFRLREQYRALYAKTGIMDRSILGECK